MQKFIDIAITQAYKSPMSNKYGAVLIYRNKVLSVGYNYDTHISTENKYGLLCG
jgi:deoxycytidylate deaminase